MRFWIYYCNQASAPYDKYAIIRVDHDNISKDDALARFFCLMVKNDIWTDCEYILKEDADRTRKLMLECGWKEEYIFRLENKLHV